LRFLFGDADIKDYDHTPKILNQSTNLHCLEAGGGLTRAIQLFHVGNPLT
jgi:hypothetical protein